MLSSSLFMSFRGLNRQPTNRAVEGLHLCLVRDTKKPNRVLCWDSVGATKVQATEQPNRDLPQIWCSSLFYQSRNTVIYLRGNKNRSKARADCQLGVSHREWVCVNYVHITPAFPRFEPVLRPYLLLLLVGWGQLPIGARQKDKAPEPNRNSIWVLDVLLLCLVQYSHKDSLSKAKSPCFR